MRGWYETNPDRLPPEAPTLVIINGTWVADPEEDDMGLFRDRMETCEQTIGRCHERFKALMLELSESHSAEVARVYDVVEQLESEIDDIEQTCT